MKTNNTPVVFPNWWKATDRACQKFVESITPKATHAPLKRFSDYGNQHSRTLVLAVLTMVIIACALRIATPFVH